MNKTITFPSSVFNALIMRAYFIKTTSGLIRSSSEVRPGSDSDRSHLLHVYFHKRRQIQVFAGRLLWRTCLHLSTLLPFIYLIITLLKVQYRTNSRSSPCGPHKSSSPSLSCVCDCFFMSTNEEKTWDLTYRTGSVLTFTLTVQGLAVSQQPGDLQEGESFLCGLKVLSNLVLKYG